MRDLLIQRFKFHPEDIELLTDKPGSLVMPTGANIIKSLNRMVDQAQPGDVLFFHYSGHGTLVDKSFLPFSKEEAIVPTDFNLITNVDFRHLVNMVPKGATFTILSDSCHSGGLIDKEKQQLVESSINHGAEHSSSITSSKNKGITLESVLQHLSSLTNINSTDVGTHLLEIFGAEASLRYRLPQIELDMFKPNQDEGILLSGCQTDETSADVVLQNGKAYGAFSNAVQQVLKENYEPLTNRELVSMARKVLMMHQFKQHPCLYCSDQNADAAFLN
ncbi:OLC1v1036177C1 [Oldenlandia corymbosa var. corymbosa]|uniref:OLC1v1036177C1 n=1 Tax=Oldenlandia corymbosa var. corymbosa TaxID=529605 RepID=A0AAV1CUS9_OLDCO|nr:OLC1v1036177C1 [Oldenlandia corymbosa var. corymbosa]